MISTVLFSLAPALLPAGPPMAAAPALTLEFVQEDADVAKRMAEAGDDVEKLMELATWCKENDKAADAREIYKRILELDDQHEAAHKALRHHFYDGQWFTSYVALSKYKRAEAKRMKEKGLARFGDEWVPEADVPYLRMGWVRGEDGEWVSQAILDRDEQIAAWKAEGRQFRREDSSWVHPDDFDKWREGLFLCGEEWLPLEEANAYHSQIGTWWTQEAENGHFIVHSTLDDKNTLWAVWYADQTWGHLKRAVGAEPTTKPEVVVLNSIAQYNTFAGGDQNARIQPAEATGISSVHYAFFADAWFVPGGKELNIPVFKGAGVSYWDVNDQNIAGFGAFSIRHAAAHSYMEALDPSWNTLSQALSSQGQGLQPQQFWDEKRMPMWLRYGIASYCERYYNDATSDNPWGIRDWALDNLRRKGGLHPLEETFAFTPNVNDIDRSTKWINETGLLVSFMLDGDSPAVRNAHGAFKKAFKEGGDTSAAAEALQKALIENQDALLAYANIEFVKPEPAATEASAESEGAAADGGQ